MKQIISSRQAYDKVNSLLQDVITQLREYTQGKVIDFGEQCFEDMAGNDICAIDNENVYTGVEYDEFEEVEKYPLHDLALLDAIKILSDLEAGVIK